MANRQDSGSNSSHENQRPNAHNEDRLPEFTDNARGRGEEGDDMDEEMDDESDEMDEEEEQEGSF